MSFKYNVNITYQQKVRNGWVGGTGSSYNYDSEYYIASMPELKVSATGSTYETALSALVTAASASALIFAPTPLSMNSKW